MAVRTALARTRRVEERLSGCRCAPLRSSAFLRRARRKFTRQLRVGPQKGQRCCAIAVVSAGIIGSVTVSGLSQRADHELVVEALCGEIGRDYADLALPNSTG